MGEVAGLITSANLAVMSAWSEGKPIVGRHVSGRNPAPPVLSLAAASQRSSAAGKSTKSFRLQSPLVAVSPQRVAFCSCGCKKVRATYDVGPAVSQPSPG